MMTRARLSAARLLALIALCLGAAAALTDAHGPRAAATAAARAQSRRGDAGVPALELATWIREQRRGVRVIDVRAAPDFETGHIPTAERIAPADLEKGKLGVADTIVVYADSPEQALQAVDNIEALGYRYVYFLRGGLYEWTEDVLNPALANNAPDSARARFAQTAEISRYFGGVPHIRYTTSGDTFAPASPADSTRARNALNRVRGRGC